MRREMYKAEVRSGLKNALVAFVLVRNGVRALWLLRQRSCKPHTDDFCCN